MLSRSQLAGNTPKFSGVYFGSMTAHKKTARKQKGDSRARQAVARLLAALDRTIVTVERTREAREKLRELSQREGRRSD